MNESLAQILCDMMAADQDMRNRSATDSDFWGRKLDKRHTEILKDIVAEYGWPVISLVGSFATQATWLIAQNSDHDVKFQEECLRLLRAVPECEVLLRHIA